jgi:hypothetical protein
MTKNQKTPPLIEHAEIGIEEDKRKTKDKTSIVVAGANHLGVSLTVRSNRLIASFVTNGTRAAIRFQKGACWSFG